MTENSSSQVEDQSAWQEGDTASADALSKPKPPRVWTVFVAIVLALVLAILIQVVVVLLIVAQELGGGTEPSELGDRILERLSTPYMFIGMLVAGQIAMGIAGVVPAILSPVPFRERIAWLKPRPSWTVYPVTMLSSIVPLAIGLLSAAGMTLLIPADESVGNFFEKITIDSAIVFVVIVGLLPGIFEEILFRGYMQTRLVKRWGAVKGVVVTSIVFGLFHITPHAIAAAIFLGFWFGYLSYRSGSILPTIACHIFVNSGLNAWRMMIQFGELSETVQHVVHAVLLLVGVVCFVICLRASYWKASSDDRRGDESHDVSEPALGG